eukprot:CAMPEP_0119559654 /NCGR_PEP_ID=MMETSP1352-20130426/13030_1 /TAXON_ID=265584 /ORGANISM="Stauroneis constricta, Strain CCMP1120" /LENGTH=106 /DNA_ID=CAMNT_0007607415 /DNA_START=14 /DNA_END=334 /DNA_ORIENTATION=+
MNALRLSANLARTATRSSTFSAQRSMMSTSVTKTDPAYIQAQKIKTAGQKIWTSDPATYPVIAVCVIAVVGCTSFIGYKFTFCKDVQVDKHKRTSVIRYWGNETKN